MTNKFLLLMILACYCGSCRSQVAYGDNAAAGHYLSTRGIRLYYETYGQGAPLLMLHINGGSINVFTNQIPYFSKNYRVIAVDTRWPFGIPKK